MKIPEIKGYKLRAENLYCNNQPGIKTGQNIKNIIWTEGVVFNVFITENWVIKIPKEKTLKDSLKHHPKKNTDTLKELCDLQNQLYKEFPEYNIPCYYFDDFIVNPKPKGKEAGFYRDIKPELQDRMEAITKEIGKKYFLGDIKGWDNFYYDEDTDTIKIIDYSHLQKK